MRADSVKRLAEVEHELRALGRGIEPRKVAMQILELLNERDTLRGVWLRACSQCGESFIVKRADAKYCSRAYKQSAYRNRALRMRVIASDSVRPVCGVPASHGQSGDSTTATATQRDQE